MKKIKFFSLLVVVAIGLLGVLLFPKTALAAGAAPADLKVGTSFTPYGSSTVALPSVPFTVDVVPVPNLIPVQGCLNPPQGYAGFHLDYNKSVGNICGTSYGLNPETNSFSDLTNGGSDNFFGAPYSYKFFDNLIWCGQAAGIQDGVFKIQVTVNPSQNKNQITYNGRTIQGKWNVIVQEIGGNNIQDRFTDNNVASGVVYNPYTTFFYFNFVEDPPSSGNAKPTAGDMAVCGSSLGDGTVNSSTNWNGWGVDGRTTATIASSPTFDIYEVDALNNETLVQSFTANVFNQARTNYLYSQAYPISATANYDVGNIPIKAELRDGVQHKVNVKIANQQIKQITFTCTDSLMWPWLQTRQGNAISYGGLLGQTIGNLPGARLDARNNKEAEFIIAAFIGGRQPFCSDYKYILSNNTALTNTACNNGWGYKDNKIFPDLGNPDKIITSATNFYNSLPANCAQEKSNDVPTFSDRPSCPDGSVFKLSSTTNSFGSYTLSRGNVTVFKDGNLTINGNINYADFGYSGLNLDTIRDVPNLTIIVNGNLKIENSVTILKANIYASGYINTCSTYTSSTSAVCTNQLNVYGTMTARNGFIFPRINRTDTINGGHEPAEIIKLYPRALLFPSPVLNKTNISGADSSTVIDYAEYQPRF